MGTIIPTTVEYNAKAEIRKSPYPRSLIILILISTNYD
jgi:hypothetical protein